MFVAYALAIRQALKDRRCAPAFIKMQATWKLATAAASWPMGFRTCTNWMFSHADYDTPRTPVRLRVTYGCDRGPRCHVTFSAGTFRPPLSNNADRQWMIMQSNVGDIVQRCNPAYRPFFDYLDIFKSLTIIWYNVLTPDQRIPFMEFVGFLQKMDLIYLKRFVDDALGTTSIETPWLDDDPRTSRAYGWTNALIRGRVLGEGLIVTQEEEPGDDATGETQMESGDPESDGDDEEMPRIVSREEPKSYRPPVFLRRMHRLLLTRPGGGTADARRALANARGGSDGTARPPAPRPSSEDTSSAGTVKSRRKALAPQPPPSHQEAQELADMCRQRHIGEPHPVSHAPPRPLPLPVAADDQQLPSASRHQSGARAPVPAPAGPIVRPWESSRSQAPARSQAPVCSIPMNQARSSTWVPAPGDTMAPEPPASPIPVFPLPHSERLPGFSFGGLGAEHLPVESFLPQEGPYVIPSDVHPPWVSQAPPDVTGRYPGAASGRRHPRERWTPQPWTPYPPRSPSRMTVRERLARMRAANAPVGQDLIGVRPPWWAPIATQQHMTPQGPLIIEPQMFPVAGDGRGGGGAWAPGVPAAPPQYFDLPLPHPTNQGAPSAHFFAQPPMATPWPLTAEQQMFPGDPFSQGVGQVQLSPVAFGPPVYVEAMSPGPMHPGTSVSSAVTQDNFSREVFEGYIEEAGGDEGSDTSEPDEALDLSIHGRPRPRTPEWPIQGEGGQNTAGPETRSVLVSAMVHMGQGADIPDLEDPPDEA